MFKFPLKTFFILPHATEAHVASKMTLLKNVI